MFQTQFNALNATTNYRQGNPAAFKLDVDFSLEAMKGQGHM